MGWDGMGCTFVCESGSWRGSLGGISGGRRVPGCSS